MKLTTVASWMFSESVVTITSVKTEVARFLLTGCFTAYDNDWMMDFGFFVFLLASLYVF